MSYPEVVKSQATRVSGGGGVIGEWGERETNPKPPCFHFIRSNILTAREMLSNSSLLHITVYTPINNNKKTLYGTERLDTTNYYICGNKF